MARRVTKPKEYAVTLASEHRAYNDNCRALSTGAALPTQTIGQEEDRPDNWAQLLTSTFPEWALTGLQDTDFAEPLRYTAEECGVLVTLRELIGNLMRLSRPLSLAQYGKAQHQAALAAFDAKPLGRMTMQEAAAARGKISDNFTPPMLAGPYREYLNNISTARAMTVCAITEAVHTGVSHAPECDEAVLLLGSTEFHDLDRRLEMLPFLFRSLDPALFRRKRKQRTSDTTLDEIVHEERLEDMLGDYVTFDPARPDTVRCIPDYAIMALIQSNYGPCRHVNDLAEPSVHMVLNYAREKCEASFDRLGDGSFRGQARKSMVVSRAPRKRVDDSDEDDLGEALNNTPPRDPRLRRKLAGG